MTRGVNSSDRIIKLQFIAQAYVVTPADRARSWPVTIRDFYRARNCYARRTCPAGVATR